MDSRKILVVDDDRQITALVSIALQRAGYDARIANGGREALRAALEDPPDLVLLDIYMPDMSGEQVLREMLRHPKLSKIPVVLATGEVERKPDPKGFSLLIKPFNVKELYLAIREALSPA